MKDLNQYIESLIERYTDFDPAHNIDHVRTVIRNSEYIATSMMNDEDIELDMNMVRIIAAMHDLGLKYDRKIHHIKSGEIVRQEEELKDYFNEEQIEIIAKAVEEHRASYKGEYTSIYSQIVSDADRMNTAEEYIARTYKWSRLHYPELNQVELYEEVKQHLRHKYGEQGYARFNTKYAEETINEMRKTIVNDEAFNKVYDEMYGLPWK